MDTKLMDTKRDVAVVGVACRLPKAPDLPAFWQLLRTGQEAIGEIAPGRWDASRFYSPQFEADNASISKWCGLLEEIDQFDHRFFNISPREAEQMDPQQRLLLQEAWHCIEDAGISPQILSRQITSVYVGVMAIDHQQEIARSKQPVDRYAALGNYDCILANRISHFFKLRGESVSIGAACASSLVALHRAKNALIQGECDYAIAAGVSLDFHPWKYISFSKARMLSPDGRCRAFDKDANGYVPGEGVTVLLLQRLDDALAAGHRIHGLVKGSAVNHNGPTSGITVPRVEAQRDVILAAYRDAGFGADTVTYVEAHGTGTSLGDPIEVEALTQAFREHTEDVGFCGLGSVKSNIGHLEAAAGLAGVIKCLLMMKHRTVPKTLHVATPNPIIDFENSPFELARASQPWCGRTPDAPLRAGVSSFGFGGSNAHVLLESAGADGHAHPFPRRDAGDVAHPFVLSAKSHESMAALVARWRDFAQDMAASDLPSACATLLTGRTPFRIRCATMVRHVDDLRDFLARAPTASQEAPTRRWGVCVGPFPSQRLAQVRAVLDSTPVFATQWQGVLDDGGAPGGLESAIQERLDAFVFQLAHLRALEALNLPQDLVTGTGDGVWAALAHAGIVTVPDVAALLTTPATTSRLKLARPRIPFLDPVSGQTFFPWRVDLEYLRQLLDGLCVPADVLAEEVRKARLLNGSQHSFKKLLNAWNPSLAMHGLTVDGLLDDAPATSGQAPLGDRRAILSWLVIRSALHQLNQKWNLAHRPLPIDARLYELSSLVAHSVMPIHAAVDLLCVPENEFETMATDLAAAIAGNRDAQRLFTDEAQAYPLLRQHRRGLDEVDSPARWLEALISSTARFPADDVSAWLLMGTTGSAAPLDPGTTVTAAHDESLADGLQRTLLDLWLHGVDVDWAALYPPGSFRTASLPLYPFHGSSFWLPGHSAADGLPPSAESRQPLPPTDRRLLSARRPVIRDHVIAGQRIVPAACFIELILEHLQRAAETSRVALRDLMIRSPLELEPGVEADIVVDLAREKKRFELQVNGQAICSGAYDEGDSAAPPIEDSTDGGVDVDVAEIYRRLAVRGYGYETSLRVMARLRRDGSRWDATLAHVEDDDSPSPYSPALVDGCLQAVLAVALTTGQFEAGALYVPYLFGAVQSWERLTDGCVAVIDESSLKRVGDDLVATVQAGDADGRCLLRLEQVRFKRVASTFMHRAKNEPQAHQEAVVGDAQAFGSRWPAPQEEHEENMLELKAVMNQLATLLAEVVGIDVEALDAGVELRDFGMDSVALTEFAIRISETLDADFDTAELFEHQTLTAVATHLCRKRPAMAASQPSSRSSVSVRVPASPPARNAEGGHNPVRLQAQLLGILSRVTEIDPSALNANSDLREFGLDSIALTEFADEISEAFHIDFDTALLFEHADIAAIAAYLTKEHPALAIAAPEAASAASRSTVEREIPAPPLPPAAAESSTSRSSAVDQAAIAIIGMSGRFPGSETLDGYWSNLAQGRDLITEIPTSRWDWQSIHGDAKGPENRTNSRWGGFLDDVLCMDAPFFKLSPREAQRMDPQQRLVLEASWHALEDGGQVPSTLGGSQTGVYVGVCNDDYNELLLESGIKQDAHTATGTYFSIIPNRVSYFLNLKGPSIAVETACSSSLVAIHLAVSALRAGDCTMALAGGVNVCLTPKRNFAFDHAGMLAADGRCKTFDQSADGYVRGEGVGMVLLKPLAAAQADGDFIYATIRGSAINHGGSANSLTAPNPTSQADVIVKAFEQAGVDAHAVSYIEAHGTGTRLGDPIEINGLKQAFARRGADGPGPSIAPHCGIGSVKTQIGHLESAAGIAGLIKVVLAMKHRTLPGSLHLDSVNPEIRLAGGPFFIVDKTQAWESPVSADQRPTPRRAGVSSFGFGGTNAHVVLEEYGATATQALAPAQERAPQLMLLSARNNERLKAYAARVADFLRRQLAAPDLSAMSMPDAAYTLQVGREHMESRLAIVASDKAEWLEKLQRFVDGRLDVPGLHAGQAAVGSAAAGSNGQEMVAGMVAHGQLELVARMWVAGLDVDWRLVPRPGSPRRLPLPGYPFERRSYSVVEPLGTSGRDMQSPAVARPAPADLRLDSGVSKIAFAPIAATASTSAPAPSSKPLVTLQPLPETPSERAAVASVALRITDKPVPTVSREAGADPAAEAARLEGVVVEALAQVLLLEAGEISPLKSFQELGVDSVLLVELTNRLNKHLGLELKTSVFYAQPTPHALAVYLGRQGTGARTPAPDRAVNAPVADASAVELMAPSSAEAPPAANAATAETLMPELKQLLAQVLFCDPQVLAIDKPFVELGLDSVLLTDFVGRLRQQYQVEIKSSALYEHTTLAALASFLARKTSAPAPDRAVNAPAADASAVELMAPSSAEAAEAADAATAKTLMPELKQLLAQVLFCDPQVLAIDKPFVELGLDSVLLTDFVGRLRQQYQVEIKSSALYEHTTLAALASFLARRTSASAPAQASEQHSSWTFTHNLSPQDNVCLRDHVIHGDYVLPTDAFLELIYRGLKEASGLEAVTFEQLHISSPCIGTDGRSVELRLKLDRTQEGFRVVVQGREDADREHRLHVRALARPLQGVLRANVDDVGAPAAHDAVLDAREIYAHPAFRALGPFYRSIRDIRIQGSSAIGRLHLTPEAHMRRDQFELSPSIMGGLLVTGLRFADWLLGDAGQLFVPVQIDKVAFAGPLRGEAYTVQLRAREVSAPWVCYDGELVSETGGVVVAIEGLRVRRFTREDLHKGSGATSTSTSTSTSASASIPEPQLAAPSGTPPEREIAVIGMAGRFPDADDVDAFWRNLAEGVDSVREVASSRWDARHFYDADAAATNRTHSTLGGWLNDVDAFDPEFFELSPFEAEIIEPQQRLFLQESWRAFEDAGYSSKRLSGVRCGVFVGAGAGDYEPELAAASLAGTAQAFTGLSTSILAARIAYYLNLKGPSLSVDTACSSSLVAIHLACRSLHDGESDIALAGGVSLMLSPTMHVRTTKSGMLSPDGRCRPFDRAANGIGLGEAVGVLVLKPLSRALADGDVIYGVIAGSHVNQDGRTNGITAPNPAAQTELTRETCRRAGIAPTDLSYVEAHGTGTPLGDPIEFDALTEAFDAQGEDRQSYAIGSVKSNIGHATFAAGVCSVVKTLLALKHQQIPPSLHFDSPNPRIDFATSPFYVARELQRWNPRPGRTRHAAVSAFGFSGTNCQLVIREAPEAARPVAPTAPCHLFVLSAKSEAALQRRTAAMSRWLDDTEAAAADVAHTLHQGRDHWPIRLAVVASSLADLKAQLRALDGAGRLPAGVFKSLEDAVPARVNPEITRQGQQLLAELAACDFSADAWRDKLTTLAEFFVRGHDFDWQPLYERGGHRRVSLPAYPFERVRCRVEGVRAPGETGGVDKLHPLVHVNASTFDACRFSSRLDRRDFYLNDHRVGERAVLPAVASLEMARAAGALAAGRPVLGLLQMTWLRPVAVDDAGLRIDTILSPEGEGETAACRIVGVEPGGEERLFAQGTLCFTETSEMPRAVARPLDLDGVKRRAATRVGKADFYARVHRLGLSLGPAFQSLAELFVNKDEALGRIELPAFLMADADDYQLHPALMDGALQTVMALAGDVDRLHLPFAIGSVTCFAPPPSRCHAYVRRSQQRGTAPTDAMKFDVQLVDDDGRVCVLVRDFLMRPADAGMPASASDASVTALFACRERWIPRAIDQTARNGRISVLVFDHDAELRDALSRHPDVDEVTLVVPGAGFARLAEGLYQVKPGDVASVQRLVDALQSRTAWPQRVLHLWNRSSKVAAATLEESLERGFYSWMALAQCCAREKAPLELLLLHESDASPDAACDARSAAAQAASEAGSAFLRTMRLEHPASTGRSILLAGGLGRAAELADVLVAECRGGAPDIHEVRYEQGRRLVREVQPFDLKQEAASRGTRTAALKHRGVYLITGGLGGLGRVVARFLARHCQARLILTSRVPAGEMARRLFAELEALGADAIHVQADVAREDQTESLIEQAQARFGSLHGVIHAAGLLRDARLVEKSLADMRDVLAPKVLGTLNLDRATRGLPLDFFACFSSVSALIGNTGQCDYAYGNRFMDSYAEQRERLREVGLRHGKSLSIDWSYWAEGGMRVEAATHELLSHLWGIEPIGSDEGCQALLDALTLADSHVLVARGTSDTMLARIQGGEPVVVTSTAARAEDAGDLQSRISRDLHAMVSSRLKISPDKITATKPMSAYGFDSISLTAFTNEINKAFQLRLSPAIFFEHKTLGGLAEALVQQHGDVLGRHFATPDAGSPARTGDAPSQVPVPPPETQRGNSAAVAALPVQAPLSNAEPIAIIGYQGLLPGSEDLDTFWQHLVAGRDLVEEIPADRWDWRACHGDPAEAGKTRARWGGFLPNVARFDAEFFGISPREAALMDPQHRLFLETAWKTIEHAGYRAADLRGSETGLFVGVCTWDYSDLGKHAEVRSQSAIGIAHTMLANRVSYLLDFKGPSEAVDTACSSSLVALQHAVDSLRSGQCRQAIVGGANLILTSGLHIAFDRAGMMSPQGRCKTFDHQADGYVRGEGCVALMLKPLARALSDGDPVHAVIKAAVVNHGGHANSLTSPNPAAQAELLVRAYEQAQVDPASVGYIECHGTGTALGDPIETTALVKAFSELYRRHGLPAPCEPHCAIGTVKTHIGHLEAAAGVAGIVNVLLAMKHRTLPDNLHFERLNPHIRLDGSPFYIATQRKPWKEAMDAQGRPLPLRAGVSSFGFGGTNAHVVLEAGGERAAATDASPQVIVLSARDEPVLARYAASLARFISNREASGSDRVTLEALAFTLQTGREPMRCRLALVSKDLAQLADSLQRFARGEAVPGLHAGSVARDPAATGDIASQRQGRQDLDELARQWAAGIDIDWRALLGERMPHRLSLPTYPFAGERHWLALRTGIAPPQRAADIRSEALRVTDPIVRDHRVGGRNTLPAVGVLERVRVAAAQLAHGAQTSLRDVVWQKALVVDRDMEVEVEFDPVPETSGSPSAWRWRLTSAGTCFATGVVEMTAPSARTLRIDVATVKARCAEPLSKSACYERLGAAGLQYGPYLMGLEQVRTGRDEALADVRLPPEFVHERSHTGFQPTLTDAALQLVAFLYPGSAPVMVPFAVDRVTLHRPPGERGHAHAKRIGEHRFDVVLLDGHDEVCVEFSGLAVRPVRDPLDDFFHRSTWRAVPQGSTHEAAPMAAPGAVLICAPLECELARAIASEHAADRVVHLEVGTMTRQTASASWTLDMSDVQAFERALGRINRPDQVYFVGGSLGATEVDDLQRGDEVAGRRVLALFRFVRALGNRGWLRAPLRLRVITRNVHDIDPLDEVEPYDAALTGFTKSLAHEFPDLDIAAVDVAIHPNRRDELQRLAAQLNTMSRDPLGCDMAVRGGRPWVRSFEALALPRAESSPFKKGGVYLILGGAGGVGLALSQHLAEVVGARLVLLGRRAASPAQLQAFEQIKAAGGEVLYLQVDATDRAAMQGAVASAKARFGALNGVFHSALVLADKSVLQMDEPTLQLALEPKLAATVSLCAAVRDEPLDFLMFFSSVQSFSGNPGQANYAAGCTFADAFARSWQAEVAYPVKVVNWGVWGEVGAVATERHLKRLRDQGALPILTHEGMEAIARVLDAPHRQFMAIKARSDLLQRLGVRFDRRTTRCRVSAMPLPKDMFRDLPSRPQQAAPAADFQRAFARLEQGIPALLSSALRQAGIPATTLTKGASALRQAMEPLPEYSLLFEAICAILERTPATATSEPLVDQLKRLKDKLPILEAHIELLGACLTDLVEVVNGRKSPMEVMFPGGSKALVEPIYRGNAVVDACQHRVADITAEYLKRHAQRSTSRGDLVRILEIGAGTGATTAFVLQAIPGSALGQVSYTYTDVSPAFIAHGQARYAAQYPFVDCRVLDITRDPVDQDFEPGSVDIVIASNVLHATPRIEATLTHAKSLLKTGGLLVINEITAAQDFSTLTFGLTHGWWAYEDGERRILHSPLLNAPSWQHALHGAGFYAVQCLNGASDADGPLRSHIFVGCSDGWISLPAASSATVRDAASLPADASTPTQAAGVRPVPTLPRTDTSAPPLAGRALKDAVRDHLRSVFADVLCLSAEKIATSAGFDQLGVDSLVALDLQRRLEVDFGKLPATLLFECLTIDALAHYLIENRAEASRARSDASPDPAPAARTPALPEQPQPPVPSLAVPRLDLPGPLPSTGRDIAIIGIAGRYPLADNLDEFWANLHSGRECITEIPPGRWDPDAFFHRDASGEDGRSYCRWGGFLRDPWAFDAAFFGLSHREAEEMTPMERLFLEVVWETLEDAGIPRRRLSADRRRVGVFVGAMYNQYGLGDSDDRAGKALAETSSYWLIANRTSYFFDFHGPSIAIDTACSASLTAVHLACQNLADGSCDVAIAGGVNLTLHPSKYVAGSLNRVLSTGARAAALGDGDGHLPGEGVGAVLLKPLAQAIADGDRIHAVIKSSGVNHGGRTSGFTVPNPNAQADLVADAFDRSDIDPRSISYVESAANGSALADAIEVAGLTRAFRRFTTESGFCSLGSVKANIGHLEAASGMSQLAKVVLQIRHRRFAPTLHAEPTNPRIELQGGPFRLQMASGEWRRPIAEGRDGRGEAPRRALINSFGAGGANAFLVVEEAPLAPSVEDAVAVGSPAALPWVFSARNPQQLRELVGRTMTALAGDVRDVDACWTLLTGREALQTRLAFVASDKHEALRRLESFVQGDVDSAIFCSNDLRGGPAAADSFAAHFQRGDLFDTEDKALDLLKRWLDGGEIRPLAELWAAGVDVDWRGLPQPFRGRRISLPSYPFARQRAYRLGSAVATPATVSAMKASDSESPVAADATGQELARVQAELRRMVRDLTHSDEDIDLDRDLSHAGFDSLVIVRLYNRVKDRFGPTIPLRALFEHGSLRKLAAFIVQTPALALHADGRTSTTDAAQGTPRAASRLRPGPADSPYRAVVLREPCEIADLRVELIEPVPPEPHEVQVLVKAFSLNFGDLLCLSGSYPSLPAHPFTPGFEIAGVVFACGSAVTRLRKGDAVFGLTGAHLGGHADVATVPECQLALKPAAVDFETACAYPAAYLAASRIFRKADVKAGDTILIQAAASGNGLMAVRFAQERGATVIATASNDMKLNHLRSLGVQHVVNYMQDDFAAKVLDATQGRGVDVVVNSLSGDAVQKGLQLLAPGGRYIELAIAGLTAGSPLDLSHLTDNQSFHSLDVRKQMQREPEQWTTEMAAMAQHLASGFAMPKIARVLPLADIRHAYELLRDRHSVGKVVVVTGAHASTAADDDLLDDELDRILDQLQSGSLTPEEAVLREGGSPGRAASYPQPF